MYRVIGVDQKTYGPVTAEQLRHWLAEGRLNAASLAQMEGAPDWKPLSAFPEFIPPPIMTPPRPTLPVADDVGGLATAGLIFGIAANLCCCLGTVFAVIGLICSLIALQRTEGRPHHGDRTIAWIGLALSLLGLCWNVLLPFSGLARHLWFRRRWRWL